MRDLTATEIAAFQADNIKVRDFVWLTVKDRDTNDEVDFGWWSDVGTVNAEVVDAITGGTVERTFEGSGTLIEILPILLSTDLSVRPVEVVLSPLAASVESAVRTYEPRGAPIQIYRGYFSLSDDLLVAPARARFVGVVDEAPITTPSTGGEPEVRLSCVSRMRELTRTNPSVRSHEDQKLRSATDDFYKDTDVVGDWSIQWGGTTTSARKTGKRFLASDPLYGAVVIV